MRSWRTILLALAFCLVAGLIQAATPNWIPLYVDGEKTIYLDEENFSTNLRDHGKNEPYGVNFWIRQETMEPNRFLEYEMAAETDRAGIVRYRMLKSRYFSPTGALTSPSFTGWQRLSPELEDPMKKLLGKVWEYDKARGSE